MPLQHLELPVHPASEPTAAAGWYLCFGYGLRPLVLYAPAEQTVWREGMRQIPITHYAGPLPEKRGK